MENILHAYTKLNIAISSMYKTLIFVIFKQHVRAGELQHNYMSLDWHHKLKNKND
jgi:hypothetical protein